MERIKITLPPNFSFKTPIAVRVTDLNYGGHVGNDTYLTLLHEARVKYLQLHQYTELLFAGTSLIMADAAIEYKRELTHFDTAFISVVASGFDKIGFDLFYLIEVEINSEWFVAAKAKTGMMCFDYKEKKRTPVPDEAIQRLSES